MPGVRDPRVPPRRRGPGWVAAAVIAAVMLVLAGGGVTVYLLANDAGPATTAGAAARYAEPPDRCTLLDAALVESWAGKPVSSEPEATRFPAEAGGAVDGCAFDLQQENVNTFKVFAGVDGDPKGRYATTQEAYKMIYKAVSRPVSGLGAEATTYAQQGGDTRRIQAGLVLYHDNLFLEVRFLAGGTEPWNPDEVQGHLADVARGIMGKLPKS
jgi:hypothetical protein